MRRVRPDLSGATPMGGQFAFSARSSAEWLPDETLFSWCSRFHRAAANGADAVTARQLFGRSRSGTAHDFPGGIDELVDRTRGELGGAWSIAMERTLLSYYAAFRPISLVREAVGRMRSQGIGSLKFWLGLLTSGLGADHPLKACPHCMVEDERLNCVAHWRRSHQWPTALVCSRHEVPLLRSNLKTQSACRFSWALPRDVFPREVVEPSSAWDDLLRTRLVRLARVSESVATSEAGQYSDPRCIAAALRAGLSDKNLVGAGARLRWGALLDAANAHFEFDAGRFESEFLRDLVSPSLLRRVLDARALTHPARYIAIIEWLFEDWASFADAYCVGQSRRVVVQRLPSSRWKTSDAVRESAMDALRRGQLTTRAISDSIGVDYATVAAWAAQEGIAPRRRPKVLDPNRLNELIDGLRAGREKSDLAEELGVSQGTVTRVMRSEPGLAERWHQVRRKARGELARKRWEALIGSTPGVSLRLLRAMAPADYAWLYRNDRQWLSACIEERAAKPEKHNHARVRMQLRDSELAAAIERTAAQLHEAEPYRPLNWAYLAHVLPALKRRQRYLHRFPMTLLTLERLLR